MMEDEERSYPMWLQPFLEGEFFCRCRNHLNKRNEVRNHFCVECIEGPLCRVGLQEDHAGHSSLQVRRASHMDAVRVCDIQSLADVSSIQTYSINGAKIMFLLCRPQRHKVVKGAPAYSCSTCGRTLVDPLTFCSIACKLSMVASAKINSPYTLNLLPPSHNMISSCNELLDMDQEVPVMPNLKGGEHDSFDPKKFFKRFSMHLQKIAQEQWNMKQEHKSLKKRKFANNTTALADKTSTDGFDMNVDESPVSPVSVLHRQSPLSEIYAEMNNLPSCTSHPCSARRPVQSIASTYAQAARDLRGSTFRRSRKGQPRRSPFV